MKFYSDALSLNEIVDELEEEAIDAINDSESMALSDIIERFEERAFGPLILIPALIAVLPTGAIPGIPSLCGIIIVLISIQLVLGQHTPWLPEQLSTKEIGGDKVMLKIQKIKPISEKISRWSYPRWESLTEETAEMAIAICCALAALCMIPLELIPFASAVPGIALILAGIGISTKDGLLIAAAGAVFACALLILWKFLL